jgi:4-hydroxy-tetrahydrodipicolinate reductase
MKIALIGYGRMGRAVEQAASVRGHEVVARLDVDENPNGQGLSAARLNGAEVAIEFTVAEAAPTNIEGLAACGADVVSGTTGWYDRLADVRRAVDEAGTGLVYAPNFSLGVQMFFRLARLAARLADRLEDYDVYIQEAHHRYKLDHPSGTARELATIVLEELSRKESWELGPGDGHLDPAVLQVVALRAGEIPGTHTLGLESAEDRIELRHEAKGRVSFAAGAIAAAEWVRGREGVFTLEEMLAETWS